MRNTIFFLIPFHWHKDQHVMTLALPFLYISFLLCVLHCSAGRANCEILWRYKFQLKKAKEECPEKCCAAGMQCAYVISRNQEDIFEL